MCLFLPIGLGDGQLITMPGSEYSMTVKIISVEEE